MGVFNSLSVLKISLSEEKCLKCNTCLDNCPMGIRELDEINDSSDCIKCGICIEECPHNALKFNFTL
jgi:NAD-dependent dihydropyrimidine dehydrogenase PreA subunit